jgi:hypothetical protein
MRKIYKTSQQNTSRILKIYTCMYGKQSGNTGMENHPYESPRGLGMAITPMGASAISNSRVSYFPYGSGTKSGCFIYQT